MTSVMNGETGFVDGYGYLPVYNYEEEASYHDDSQFLVPSDNLNSQMWSSTSKNGARVLSPSAGIRVVSSHVPGADYQHMAEYYGEEYEAYTHQAPGELTTLMVLLIIGIITAVLLTIAATTIACHLIDKAYSNTTETLEDNNGDTIYKSCVGSLFGGTKCVFYNPRTGKTSDAGNAGGMTDFVKPAVYILGLAGLAYVGFKIVLPALEERSRSGSGGYMTQAYNKTKGYAKKVF